MACVRKEPLKIRVGYTTSNVLQDKLPVETPYHNQDFAIALKQPCGDGGSCNT